MRCITVLASAIVALCLCLAQARAEKRMALVVGNNSYTNLPADQQLMTAVNDARAIDGALSRLGFEVIEGENLSHAAFSTKFDELTRKLLPGDMALFYFAGHGVTLGGGNYLLPSDVPNVEAGQESLLARTSLSEDDIVADLQARGVRVAVIVLDACRSNPFKRSGQRSVGGERGLSRIEATGGVFKLYSAGIGQSALDRLGRNDRDPNSVFTRVLVPELTKPGLDMTNMAKEVGREVQRLASTVNHEQQPAYYDQVLDNVYLAGAPSSGKNPPKPSDPTTSFGEAERAWSDTKDTTSQALLEEFVRRFGDSYYASLARARLQELQRNQVAAVVPPALPAPAISPCGYGSAAMTVSLLSRTPCPLSGVEERSLKPKDVFRECEDCPEMVVMPAGSFVMGSSTIEERTVPYGPPPMMKVGPQHQVTIDKPFAVGRSAVSFHEWDACAANGGCGGYRPDAQGQDRGRRPVINVSWERAMAYVSWLSARTGKTYRLLSEAEWEYVAQAGTTAPVDVFEWLEDCANDSYSDALTDGSAQTTGDCDMRILRGKFLDARLGGLRSVNRNRKDTSFSSSSVGYRVARTLTP